MWYSKQLRLVRWARKVAKAQQYEMLALELEGITAITLHTTTHTLTVPIKRETGGQLVDTLREALRDRRRVLQTEARQLRQDWEESKTLRDRQQESTPEAPSQ
jgi:hypothetical protein